MRLSPLCLPVHSKPKRFRDGDHLMSMLVSFCAGTSSACSGCRSSSGCSRSIASDREWMAELRVELLRTREGASYASCTINLLLPTEATWISTANAAVPEGPLKQTRHPTLAGLTAVAAASAKADHRERSIVVRQLGSLIFKPLDTESVLTYPTDR